ncbi:MAG: putative maltokinase, partial [Bdellovibrionales bacterium]
GDNIYLGDRDGVRTPFQWSADRNAGFSRANPQRFYLPVISAPEYHAETINVENLSANPTSLLWWMNRLITLRTSYPELSRGKLDFLTSSNPKVLSYIRQLGDSTIICVANLSRNAQYVELDLSRFKGCVPTELFGQTDFPPVGDLPYFLTLGPYAFYWFQMVEKQSLETGQWLLKQPPPMEVDQKPLHSLMEREMWTRFEKRLRSYLPRARWFAGKGRRIGSVSLEEVFFITQYERQEESALTLLSVSYTEGLPDTYVVGLSYAEGERAQRIRGDRPDLVIAETSTGIFYDAIFDGGFSQSLLDIVRKRRSVPGRRGKLVAEYVGEPDIGIPEPTLSGFEQSNSSVIFGEQLYLKLYRRIDEGENPEIEIGRFLRKQDFKGTAPYMGALSYQSGAKVYSLAVMQGMVPNESDGWTLIVDQLGQLAERLMTEGVVERAPEYPSGTLADLRSSAPPEAYQLVASYTLQLAAQLGVKTAEMHRALGHEDRDPAFIPEPYTPFHQRSVFQSFRNLTDKVLTQLRSAAVHFEGSAREMSERVLAAEEEIYTTFSDMKKTVIDAPRTRIHGDYHLGQVLFTGEDFYIIDFEGEPARGLGERRLKRCPLKDVAGMLRSFDYAAEFYLRKYVLREQDRERLEPHMRAWSAWASVAFVNSYLDRMRDSGLLPADLTHVEALLNMFVLEKALYEVGYELRNRPDWVGIPLQGVVDVLQRRRPK